MGYIVMSAKRADELTPNAALTGEAKVIEESVDIVPRPVEGIVGLHTALKGTEMFDPEKLPPPDEMGFFFHPDIPGEDEDDDVHTMCLELGFDAKAVAMEDDAPALIDEWFEAEDMTAPARWTPTPPKGDGWKLVAKYDTEDGPAAMFVTPNAE